MCECAALVEWGTQEGKTEVFVGRIAPLPLSQPKIPVYEPTLSTEHRTSV